MPAIRHAEANDLISRNVAALADTPKASRIADPVERAMGIQWLVMSKCWTYADIGI